MKFKLNGFNLINFKEIRDLLYFYWLDNKIISCKWKHTEKARMGSDNLHFLCINGLRIFNDRSEENIAYLYEN